ncbi:hypothetical protein [Chamaesiphon sp.]|uniref:hypothetical protein n=1 Tax=Chamaesiphon sp. TaxID=2814140 RepID=UPI003593B377
MTSNYSRRNFLQQITIATASLVIKDSIFSLPAGANESNKVAEKYLVSIPFLTAREGGDRDVMLYSGISFSLKIPQRIQDNTKIEQNGIEFNIRTLYDTNSRIAAKIYDEIDQTQFISTSSKSKCKSVYEEIEDCKIVKDIPTLELLDYLVLTSSNLSPDLRQRYEIASNNSRWVQISQVIDRAVNKSDSKLLLGTLESIKAGQPIPDFKALTQLNSIVLDSNLSEAFKQTYTYGSTLSRAITVDYLILQSIDSSNKLDDAEKQQYLATYQQVREGKKDLDPTMGAALDLFIYTSSNLPANAQVVYKEAREQSLAGDENLANNILIAVDRSHDLQQGIRQASQNASALVPSTTTLLSAAGLEAGTGVSIASLTGAAATNATLAWLGGGSVAAGGLGMLGGLAVVTGGAALIGAAGVVSFGLLAQMDGEDFKNLGIAMGGGTVVAGGVAFLAWTAATATGVAGSLSGAAAITTTMTALGGLSVMTGGTAAVALGGAYVIWSLLDLNKQRNQGVLEELEAKTYVLITAPQPESLAGLITNKIDSQYKLAEVFIAPQLPLNLLVNAYKSWLEPDDKETVVALIDTSILNDAKQGVAFTSQRIIWKETWLHYDSLSYPALAKILNSQGLEMIGNEESRTSLDKLRSLANLFADEDDKNQFSAFIQKLGKGYIALTNQKPFA